MPDTFTTITNFINSPPGHLVAGGVLAGIIWKFFERVEGVLKDETKKEIGIWLLHVKVGHHVGPWPDTFAKVFDRVFGSKHLSLKCFLRSCVASLFMVIIATLFTVSMNSDLKASLNKAGFFTWDIIVAGGSTALAFNILPDYLSLLKTRWLLRLVGQGSV